MVTGELNELLEEYENLTVAFVFEGNKEDQINCCDLYLLILFLLWVVVESEKKLRHIISLTTLPSRKSAGWMGSSSGLLFVGQGVAPL